MNFKKTDPEFMERFEHFAFEEVPERGSSLTSILATLQFCLY